jgi:hypothetical protein
MTMSKRPGRTTALGAIAAVLAIGLAAADGPTRKIDAGGLTFEAPASWKATPPRSSMRRAQLTIEPAGGDKEPAELVVFAFPGGGGTVEDNIKRWQSGFKDESGNPPKVESKVVKGQNVEATRVETHGRYVAPVFPGSPETNDKPNYRLLGGIVQSGGIGYYFKLVGPDKTVTAARDGFDSLLKSLHAESK